MHWDDEPIVTNSCHTYNMNLFTYIASSAGSWVEGTSVWMVAVERNPPRDFRFRSYGPFVVVPPLE